MNGTEHLLVGLACVVLGVGVQWLAWRLRLSSILLLLAAGYLAGPVTGIIDPDEMLGDLLLPIVSLSVGLVLFEGALSLRFDELRNAGSVIRNLVTIGHLIEFKENLRVLLISTLFILLAARFQPSELEKLGFWSIGFLAFLLAVVRPVAVLASTIGSPLAWRDRAFLAWLAPRGVVAVSFASVFALRAGEHGEGLVAATFLVVVGTVAIYGLTITPLARVLGVADANPQGLLIAGARRLGSGRNRPVPRTHSEQRGQFACRLAFS